MSHLHTHTWSNKPPNNHTQVEAYWPHAEQRSEGGWMHKAEDFDPVCGWVYAAKTLAKGGGKIMFQYKCFAVTLIRKDMAADMHVGGQTAPQNTSNKWNEGRGCLHEWKAFVFPSQKT